MTKYYVDTCIWIDCYENRSDNLRPLGEFAFNFFLRLEDEDIVYYSKLTLRELRKKYSDTIILSIFDVAKDNLVFLDTFEEDITNSKRLLSSGLVHDSDAIHIALSRRVGALLITRDKEILFSGLVKAFRPEELV